MPADRRQARVLAMQVLCQADVQSKPTDEELAVFLANHRDSSRASSYADTLVRAFWADHKRIDELISRAAHKWDLERISPVERNLMRVAVAEWSATKTPPKVALNEAIEIAREYGGADSPGFVNGILDNVLKKQQEGLT